MNNQQQYCHSGSIQNYFMSPRMPIKDHLTGLKSTGSSFKPKQSSITDDHRIKSVLGSCKIETLQQLEYIQKIKNMKLMDTKSLSIVNYKSGKQNSNVNSHHDRQTNAGYSRNKLGGIFTS